MGVLHVRCVSRGVRVWRPQPPAIQRPGRAVSLWAILGVAVVGSCVCVKGFENMGWYTFMAVHKFEFWRARVCMHRLVCMLTVYVDRSFVLRGVLAMARVCCVCVPILMLFIVPAMLPAASNLSL